MSPAQSPFPPVRRVVTGHTSAGKSMILSPESAAPMYDLHYSGKSPAVIDTEISKGEWADEVKSHPEVFSGDGSNFRCWDFAPGDVSDSYLDYAIVFKGSVILELEEGERVTLNEGDTVVQRGTIHTWRNETTEWAKIYFVMLSAKPIEIDGKTLKQEFHKAE
ncbi:hypothetical protein B0H13DRAFT_2014119 [Mycena leptocephala]|nr:hypothetical protein B0H13DRAFT_2014119 [Mycena leptocephala]